MNKSKPANPGPSASWHRLTPDGFRLETAELSPDHDLRAIEAAEIFVQCLAREYGEHYGWRCADKIRRSPQMQCYAGPKAIEFTFRSLKHLLKHGIPKPSSGVQKGQALLDTLAR
jgi:hypothetical protein